MSAVTRISESTATVTIRCETTPPPGWNLFVAQCGYDGFALRTEWATIFSDALHHQPWFLWAEQHETIVGVLPLMSIRGPIFGSFLVSQPYLNSGGVAAASPAVETRLIDAAAALADRLNVRHLELRHERFVEHPQLSITSNEKVHMRLALPGTSDELWNGFRSKLRSQIRRPLADPELQVRFGHMEELDAFYAVFCRNMRDLGTPPFPRSLFQKMLGEFGHQAEICSVSRNGQTIASGFLLHGPGVTLIPSASSLKEYNFTSCNMLMYWHALQRAVALGQSAFDFGRSTPGSGTWKFKQQWGAEEYPAVWQYYSRHGSISDARPANSRYSRLIEMWKKLPVWVTRLIGPTIVRGIP